MLARESTGSSRKVKVTDISGCTNKKVPSSECMGLFLDSHARISQLAVGGSHAVFRSHRDSGTGSLGLGESAKNQGALGNMCNLSKFYEFERVP